VSDLPLFLPGERESKKFWNAAWSLAKAVILMALGAAVAIWWR